MTKPPETLVTGDSSTPMSTTTICGHCKSEANPFLHYIKHRGIFRRLCTSCILRFNSQSFCPCCFLLHNPTTPFQDSTTPCCKCHSISHTTCIGPNPSGNSYVCGLCSGAFVFKKDMIDRQSAAALLAAAKISYESMSKARGVARGEVDKRAKEAWSTKKRAREGIEHVVSIEEKLRKGDFGVRGRIVGNVGERNLFGDGSRIDRVDNSSAVLASLNAVELNDKDKGNGENGGSDGFGRQMVTVVDEKPIAVMGPYALNNCPRDGNGGLFK